MQANHLRPAPRCLANLLRRPRKIFFLIRSAAHLHKSHRKFVAHALNPITNIFLLLVANLPKLSSRPESQRSLLARSGETVATMLCFQNHSLQQSPSSLRFRWHSHSWLCSWVFLLRALCVPPPRPLCEIFSFSPLLAFFLSTSSTLHIQFLFAPQHRIHSGSVRRVDGQKAKKNCHRARSSRPRERQTPPHLSSRSLQN